MIKVNIFEAKARLSEYLDQLERGEEVIICKRNHPIAELRLIRPPRSSPRPIGGAKGQFEVPESFFDPLPAEVIDTFYPGAADALRSEAKVAERRMRYGSSAPGGNARRRQRRRRS